MVAPGEEPTTERLIIALAEAGEVDAGVEVLEVLRARDPESPALVRLQARLFASEEVSEDIKRAVLEHWHDYSLDLLASRGHEAEYAIAKKVIMRVFHEERATPDVVIAAVDEETTERTIEFEDTLRRGAPAVQVVETPPAHDHNVEVLKRKIVRLR